MSLHLRKCRLRNHHPGGLGKTSNPWSYPIWRRSDGRVLNAPLAELRCGHEGSDSDGTLESLERQYIVRVLRDTSGVIAGPHGAAVRLGMKRTTLQSRILKMGISRQEYE